jgi:hypothetical protein
MGLPILYGQKNIILVLIVQIMNNHIQLSHVKLHLHPTMLFSPYYFIDVISFTIDLKKENVN